MRSSTFSIRHLWFFAVLNLLVAQAAWGQGSVITVGFDSNTLEEILGQRTSWNFKETPLTKALAGLAQDVGVDIRLDVKALTDAAIATNQPVTLQLTNERFQTVLEEMLEPLDLTWMPRHGAICVTTQDVVEVNLVTRVYAVGDLVTVTRGNLVEVDFDTLVEAVTNSVAMNEWLDNGGNGTIEEYYPTGALVISQTWQIYQQLEPFFDALRKARKLQTVDWARVQQLVRPQPTVFTTVRPARPRAVASPRFTFGVTQPKTRFPSSKR